LFFVVDERCFLDGFDGGDCLPFSSAKVPTLSAPSRVLKLEKAGIKKSWEPLYT
jgi:hypothetical protein